MRSIVAIVVLSGILAAVEPTPARAQFDALTGPKVVEPLKQAPAETHMTIAVIGDSLGDGLWEGLYRRLRSDKRLTVARGAKHSVGFAGSDMTEQIDQAFDNGPVDALAMMIGANDDRRSFFVDGRALALFGTPKWIALYRERVEKFMDHAKQRSVPLVWVLLPVMREPEAAVAAKLINDIVAAAALGRAHVSVVQTWGVTADESGAYMPHFNDLGGKKRLMRHADGLHFTEPGYELLAHLTFTKLLEASPRFKAMVSDIASPVVR